MRVNRKKAKNIVLFGQMRAGKDTVADYIKEQYKYMDFKFSHGITEIIEDYFPVTMRQNKPRELYQNIGQYMRSIYPNVWIEHTFKDIWEYCHYNDLLKTTRPIIISDGRQYNEAEVCRAKGYVVVKVVADRAVRLERIRREGDNFTEDMLEHETEKEVERIPADYTILNNGTIEELMVQLDLLMKELEVSESGATNE